MTAMTETVFESTEGMSDSCNDGLHNLLMACADTKLLLGYHYGEWTFGPPEIEAAIASCSLSQTELGHVRLLHALLKKHYGHEPDRLVDQRPSTEFANISYLDGDIPDWAGYVAMNCVVDLAITRLLHAMRGSSFKPLRMSLEKMLDEERHHIHHGLGWLRTLAIRNDDSRKAAEGAVRDAMVTVVAWFGPPNHPEDQALVEAGIKTKTNPEIVRDLLDDLTKAAEPLGVSLDVDTAPSLDGWNPKTRRNTESGPGDEILYHLRGSKNELFKLT